jgi:hypothetical protein
MLNILATFCSKISYINATSVFRTNFKAPTSCQHQKNQFDLNPKICG